MSTRREYDAHTMYWINDTGSDALSDQIVVAGTLVGVVNKDIPAGKRGLLEIDGGQRFPKATGAMGQGVKVYWKAAGDPVDGEAGSGALTTVASGAVLAGRTLEAADENAPDVLIKLNG